MRIASSHWCLWEKKDEEESKNTPWHCRWGKWVQSGNFPEGPQAIDHPEREVYTPETEVMVRGCFRVSSSDHR